MIPISVPIYGEVILISLDTCTSAHWKIWKRANMQTYP